VNGPHSARFVFDYASPEAAALVDRSVSQELGEIDGDRTTATVDRDGSAVTVTVSADDLTALRAGLNTWTTLVEVAESVAGV
jgi:KEOPS complex subunit Pcc1